VLGNPSEHLQGKVLDGGWTVGAPIPIGLSTSAGTGGNFTLAYNVTGPDGRKAFLKALDYSRAMHAPSPARALQSMTAAYLFECAVLDKCRERNLDRVVRAITNGTILINEPTANGAVEYIIFEFADGDVRKHLKFTKDFELAWKLRSLHHIATGLKQLHGSQIAHQDLKPSNVLVYDGKISKLADMGRASYQGHTPAHDQYAVAGDPSYAPPDLAYGFVLPEWNMRRLSCDIYHLGSMAVFFFTGVGMTRLLFDHLDPAFQPSVSPFVGGWTGTFEDVLPYVRDAYDRAINAFAGHIEHPQLREKLVPMVRQLCEPDSRLRGHPLTRRANGNTFFLERYITDIDLLARRAEIGSYKDAA
jgi:serine/threonine protein kinase